MAQEIQRKLEETEVKTRELEERGVSVEKALRGEVDGRYAKDESELLQEWFDLMRDRTELRRYERELMVRAQELELEDRHARLQHDLRERLENDEQKTEEEVQVEGSIINEMMEIVAKRDSLIALLEEDRLRTWWSRSRREGTASRRCCIGTTARRPRCRRCRSTTRSRGQTTVPTGSTTGSGAAPATPWTSRGRWTRRSRACRTTG
jgi:hypothetical protein